MRYLGMWKLHSCGTFTEDAGIVYLTPQELLDQPIEDPEYAEEEMRDRKSTIGTKLEVSEDGNAYLLMPLPEGVPQEEVDAAVAAGEIFLRHGMMTDQRGMAWELRQDELWLDTGIEGEIFDEKADSWVKLSIDENTLQFMTFRFVKEE